MTYSQLWYYLPTHFRIPNPSRELSRIAVRIDGSVWVMPRGYLPHNLIADLVAAGGRVGTLDYAEYQSDAILQLVRAALEKEVSRITEALATSQRSNAHRADINSTGPERDHFRKRSLGNLSRARRLLRDVTSAIERFGMDGLSGSLAGAWAAVEARRIEMEVRAKAYARMTAELNARPDANGQGLAAEARSNTLPPMIGAGYLEDHATSQQMLDAAQGVAEAWSSGS